MQKITPFLWFDNTAEQAAKFYASVFKGGKILSIARYTETGPGKPGSVMTVKFRILGQEFVGLNGGTDFKITPAISFVVTCDNQKEVDYYWAKLSAGGKKIQCGWLEDKYGVSWQVVPGVLYDLISDKEPERSDRVMAALMKMVKLDIKRLQQAYRGK